MGKIRREWLERIPNYGWAPKSDAPPGQPQEGEPDHGPVPPGEEGAPTEAEANGIPPDATPGEGSRSGEEEGDPFQLSIPEEVENRRKDEEEKLRRFPANRALAPRAFGLEGHYLRNLATRFARMISKVAEDSADLPAQGDEEWDYNELLKRHFTGRLIHQCRMTREKRKVAIVLDTSPSCEHQARLFAAVARIAEELGDCELYEAPNFAIIARKFGAAWEQLPSTEEEWAFKGRAVLAFGDFDGIERICEASAIRGNRIYWFCCEERPQVLETHRETFVKRYKGKYFPATTLQQLLHAIARVR